MMRANLLPKAQRRITIFGTAVDAGAVARASTALAGALAVGVLGIAIETMRLDRLEAALAIAEQRANAGTASLASDRALELDLARYQQFDRTAALVRRSGSDAALAIARIGNALPAGVRLSAVAHDGRGFTLDGSASDVEDLGDVIGSLGRALPHTAASFDHLDRTDPSRGRVHFSADLASVSPAPEGAP